ncbi:MULTISPECIES: MFS transporter [unclassified Lactococcus]|uniref:MFS transporter n=1 Tax=unclassified Lactococcus TaxID=2643510 RepID=UPI0011C8C3FE|nr:MULTISPECIES: MFS transporter [unclassified Lactococcus]MQW22295.1 DUF4190 domain-containing protein [Lactococcus sp. dk101]TXK45224.1 MFS transporter [Lactococcus sp. dk310]TXK50998.1 MFS transporter [Lactococcus sp. dk322]
MEKQNEKKVLAIIGLVFGGIGLLMSWLPILNTVGAFFAVIGLVLGLIAFFVNLRRKKILSLITVAISLGAIAIVLVTQSMYSKALDKVGNEVKTTISSQEKKANDQFKWTLADYNALKTGDTITGAGGTNYDSLATKFGKATHSSETTSGDFTIKNVSWDNMGASTYKSVDLTFTKQSDGSFLLSNKMQSGLE